MGLGIEPCAQLGLKQSADSLMEKYDLVAGHVGEDGFSSSDDGAATAGVRRCC